MSVIEAIVYTASIFVAVITAGTTCAFLVARRSTEREQTASGELRQIAGGKPYVAPHEHDARPVAVVIRGESTPVRWICPECGEETPEPEPLGPLRSGGTMAVGKVVTTGTIQANKITTGPIQTAYERPKPRTEAELLERLEHLRWHQGPGSRGVYACCMFVGTTVSDEIRKVMFELGRVERQIIEESPRPVRDGWRQEHNGSWTQIETPKVTELAIGQEKPLQVLAWHTPGGMPPF